MAFQIEDGGGSGRLAKVNSSNQLSVNAVSRTNSENAIVNSGDGYNINTGLITFTSDSESAAMFIKNNESSKNLILTLFIVQLGVSTGATTGAATTISMYRNPTAGTIVSNAVDCDIPAVNQNFGSTRTFDGFTYKGAEGYTLTDGTLIEQAIAPYSPNILNFAAGETVLPPSTSIGVKFTPPASNTSMTASFSFRTYLQEPA